MNRIDVKVQARDELQPHRIQLKRRGWTNQLVVVSIYSQLKLDTSKIRLPRKDWNRVVSFRVGSGLVAS